MTEEMIALRSMLEKGTDAELLREMIGFAAQRLMELEVQVRRNNTASCKIILNTTDADERFT